MMTKTSGFLAVALLTVATVVAILGFSPAAMAATFQHLPNVGDFLGVDQFAPHMAATLLAMRANLVDLKARADGKAAEIKSGMTPDEVRKIETDHDAIKREIETLEKDIKAEEAKEAAAALEAESRRNPAPAPVVNVPLTAADLAAASRAAVDAERTRAAGIRSLAASANASAFGETHANSGTDLEGFRSALLDHLMSAEGPEVRSNTRVQVGQSDHEKRAVGVANALLHRSNPTEVQLTEEGRHFRGMSLLEIGRDLLEVRGVSTRGMSRNELAEAALMQRTGGLMTTTDFPGILANVSNTRLRAAYTAAPQTFRPITRVTSVSDFKAVTRAQLGEAPSLNKVNEHGEFKRGSMGEGKESYKIATYGKIVGITRQVIVNDDLDAFARIPAAFGVQAAQLESDLVWAQILANPTMGDGIALFHASHGNLAGTAAVIDVTSMSLARTAFGTQTGLDGKTVLGLTAKYLIVPLALQTKAEQFLTPVNATQTSNVVPESVRNFTVIAEPRLDMGINRPEDDIVASGSATAWYLAGDPSMTDIVELAYLDGNTGVYTETRTGFDIDGVELKVRLDVGAKVLDHRNISKNAGVAP